MKKPKKRKLKGFAKLLSNNLKNNLDRKEIKEITKALTKLDTLNQDNKSQPKALEKFLKLVEEKNTEKLVEYFKQYGIAPKLAELNLDNLIAEEIKDLSS